MGKIISHVTLILEEIVTNVISIDKKLQLSEDRKKQILRRRKVLAIQQVLQCTRCALKCEKCGTNVSESQRHRKMDQPYARLPYRFCESCSDEYLDYIERLKGKGDADCYWRNDAWLAGWRHWIDYQAAIDRYVKSKEFQRLVKEFKSFQQEE